MKNIIYFTLVTMLISCQPKDLPTVFEQKEGYAIMKVSHQTTQADLSNMMEKLTSQEIIIDFSGSQFFDDNKIKILVLSVVTPEGTKGVTKADIVALQYRYFGFIYDKKGRPTFKIGEI